MLTKIMKVESRINTINLLKNIFMKLKPTLIDFASKQLSFFKIYLTFIFCRIMGSHTSLQIEFVANSE